MKAKLGNKEDREYYQQYCKDGVDFAKLVLTQIIWIFSDTVKWMLQNDKYILKSTLNFFFDMDQSPPEILRDGLCPAMLMPSKPCKWET